MVDPYLPLESRIGSPRYGAPPSVEMPGDVRLVANLVLILAIYAAVMTLPTGIVGAFVGPPILYGFLVHLALALVLFPCWKGLLHKMRWARWAVAIVSAIGMTALPAAAAQHWLTGSPSVGELAFALIISSYAAAMHYTLFTFSSNAYFSKN